MSAFCSKFHEHTNAFRLSHPFKSFCIPRDGSSADSISNRIKKAIINKLREITKHQLELDVALTEIYVLFHYATHDLHQIFPDYVYKTFITYYLFFFHFLIFGCCLGKDYLKYIALKRHKDQINDEALRYCIDEFIPNLSKSSMKYKYCNSARMQTSHTLKSNYGLNDDIIHLINDFTAFHFEEFLMKMMTVDSLWAFTNDHVLYQFRAFVDAYRHHPDSRLYTILFTVPHFLLNPRFMCIEVNDTEDDLWDNIQHFANAIQFEFIAGSDKSLEEFVPRWIQEIYEVPYLTIKPWTHPFVFIELFERLDMTCCIGRLFEKCINIEEAADAHIPLSILYNGHMYQQNRDEMIDEQEMRLMYNGIDALFEFLMKYFVTNIKIMENLFYQIIHCLIYFLHLNLSNTDRDCKYLNALKEGLINKLIHIVQMHIIGYIDENEFMKVPKYKQSFENLKQIKSFDTNVFYGRTEEVSSSDEEYKQRKSDQVSRIAH